jgi:hypothetical protein
MKKYINLLVLAILAQLFLVAANEKPLQVLRKLPCTNVSEVPTFDPLSSTPGVECKPLYPAYSMAAMKWLVTPTSSCPGTSDMILGRFPTCSMWEESRKRKEYCMIVILEDLFSHDSSCQDPSMDLVLYWLNVGCKVRYVTSGLATTCKGHIRKNFELFPGVLFLKRFPWSAITAETVDILYVLDRYGEGVRALADFLNVGKWTPVIDQFVLQLDYSCPNARGPGNDPSFPGWVFYHLYYYLSGGDVSYGRYENMGTIQYPGDDMSHSRCFRGTVNVFKTFFVPYLNYSLSVCPTTSNAMCSFCMVYQRCLKSLVLTLRSRVTSHRLGGWKRYPPSPLT